MKHTLLRGWYIRHETRRVGSESSVSSIFHEMLIPVRNESKALDYISLLLLVCWTPWGVYSAEFSASVCPSPEQLQLHITLHWRCSTHPNQLSLAVFNTPKSTFSCYLGIHQNSPERTWVEFRYLPRSMVSVWSRKAQWNIHWHRNFLILVLSRF